MTTNTVAGSADQLVLYGVTVSRMSRSLGLNVKLHFGILTKGRSPSVQVLVVPTGRWPRTSGAWRMPLNAIRGGGASVQVQGEEVWP